MVVRIFNQLELLTFLTSMTHCNQCGQQVTTSSLSPHIAAMPGHTIFYKCDPSSEPHDHADPEYQPANSADYDETWADMEHLNLMSVE